MRRSALATGLLLVTSTALGATHIQNVRGYSVSADRLTRFSEILIDNGQILAVGSGELQARYPDAERMDGQGKTMLPGLIDTHGHVSSLGFVSERIDLTDSPSLSDALSVIREFAERNPDADWLRGRGWNQVLWSVPEFPSRADLDRIVPDRPVWLERIDGHAGWANSAALAAAGIGTESRDPAGGRIMKGPDGEPTGILIDNAMQLVNDVLPPADEADLERVITRALERLASLGVTSVHDAGIPIEEARVYRSLADRGALPIRVYAMLAGADENLRAFGQPLIGHAGGFLSVASVKIYADGALGSRGAALLTDYSDDPGNRGLLLADRYALSDAIRRSNARGFQANVHAIGDRANRVVLDAFELVQQGRTSKYRNRIEHAQVISESDIPRFASLGIIAAIQPTHATSDKNMAEVRLGGERIKGGYAWQRMLGAGVTIAGGSDFPVEPENPMYGLHAAVTRQDRDGEPSGGWYPDQSLSREQALRIFTWHAAYAAHQEQMIGELAPDKRADFILVDQDFFEMPAGDIWKIRVLETWVNGKRVYRAQ